MADDGMDPCECIWSHEFAMRRLLSLLRQSQTVCTDTECFDEGFLLTSVMKAVPRLPGAQSSQDNGLMMMLVTWMAVALMMFMMRPRSLRNKADADYRNNEGDDDRPPPPAVN